MAIIKITDLLPIHHGEAVLKVATRRTKSKGISGYRGKVLIEFPKTPAVNYSVDVPGEFLRVCDTDATADAIDLRREIIAENHFSSATKPEGEAGCR